MANWQSASSIEGLILPGAPANPPGYAPAYPQAPATGTIGYYTPEHLGVHFAGAWGYAGAYPGGFAGAPGTINPSIELADCQFAMPGDQTRSCD
jgi:hypothetical protein